VTSSQRRGVARIAVDLLGGDAAPAVVVDGALRAAGADPDIQLLLVGPPEVADEVRSGLPEQDRWRVTVRAVHQVVGMAEPPLRGVRGDTTVRAAVGAIADGTADGIVSAGASGAAVTAAVHGLGRLPRVRRPALAATLPALAGPVVLLDLGANTEATAAVLVQHAALGATYAQVAGGVEHPRVGLLSVGTEPGKGDRARRSAAHALGRPETLPTGASFAGTVEGYDVPLGGPADVVVTDGFTGNVLLKGIEGAYALAAGHETASGPRVSVPRAAALLGVPGIVIVCHGAAVGADVADGIALAARLHRLDAMARLAGAVEPPSPEPAPAAAEVSP
jgi:glycerol-3-phosphate acyltransferase PlsX